MAAAPNIESPPSPAPPKSADPPQASPQPPPPSNDSPPPESTNSPPPPTSPPPPPKESQRPPPPTENVAPPPPPSSSSPPTSSPPSSSPPSLPSPPSRQSPAPKPNSPPPPKTNSPFFPPPPLRKPPHTPSLRPPAPADQNKGGGSSPETGHGNQHIPIILGVAGALIIVFLAIMFLVLRKRQKKDDLQPGILVPPKNLPGPANNLSNSSSQPIQYQGSSKGGNGFGTESDIIGGSKVFFTYEEIMEMTGGFSERNIIGEGGFGCVYKGQMPDGKLVAVKNLKTGGGQGDREFKAEVEIISRVHHRHLVSLVGYCISQNNRVLIYEFLPNNTLQHHLHGRGLPVLDWSKRQKIALGAARGLAYLHEYCHPKIIHRDIKSANILLDDEFEAQVADFGLARLHNDAKTHVSTRVMGTFGYLAPEYAQSGKLTDKSDVYSFGVVLLELITGHKAVDPNRHEGDECLVEWARPLLLNALKFGDLSDLVDPCLENNFVEGELFRMTEAAVACIRRTAPKRPRMVQVVRALEFEEDMSDLSNGVKYGQSALYSSGEYQQHFQRFRRMAFGSGNSSDFSPREEYTSNEHSDCPSSEEYRPNQYSSEGATNCRPANNHSR